MHHKHSLTGIVAVSALLLTGCPGKQEEPPPRPPAPVPADRIPGNSKTYTGTWTCADNRETLTIPGLDTFERPAGMETVYLHDRVAGEWRATADKRSVMEVDTTKMHCLKLELNNKAEHWEEYLLTAGQELPHQQTRDRIISDGPYSGYWRAVDPDRVEIAFPVEQELDETNDEASDQAQTETPAESEPVPPDIGTTNEGTPAHE